MNQLFSSDITDPFSSNTDNAINVARIALQAAQEDASRVDLSWIDPLPPDNGWTLAPDALRFLTSLVTHLKPMHILEFGSGLSTQLLVRRCNELALACGISSVDHDPEYCWTPIQKLTDTIYPNVSLQIAPLVARECAGKLLPMYHLQPERFASQYSVDLVVIDGPPTVLGGREGVLYQALEFARPGTLMLLDDANRPEEQAALAQWQCNLGETIEVIMLPGFAKGLAAIIIHQIVRMSELEMLRLRPVIQDIDRLIPKEDAFIFVDQEQLGTGITSGRYSIPFLEKDGQYWGPPLDDETAINELERLRQSRAKFIVFAWNTFWWLDYYKGLNDYLRSKYQCVLENERLIIFAL